QCSPREGRERCRGRQGHGRGTGPPDLPRRRGNGEGRRTPSGCIWWRGVSSVPGDSKSILRRTGTGAPSRSSQILVNGGGEQVGGPLGSLLAGLLSSAMIKKDAGNVVPFSPAAE